MNLHEYQAKHLFSSYGLPVPRGTPAFSEREAVEAATALGGGQWVVKAQVHAGGRGKAGGVKLVGSVDAVGASAGQLLGSRLVTAQTGSAGLPVNAVLIEEVRPIARELYLSAVVDRSSARVLFLASSAGGMDIEEVAAQHPEKILSLTVDPAAGLQAYQCREIGFALGLRGDQVNALTKIMNGMYRLFLDKDLSQIEINPLVVTEDGALLVLDAKINIDDNALFAHTDLAELRDPAQEDPKESAARQHGLSYVTLDGNIGCMVNGAGLAMATLDVIKLYGGEPANFLDVGGGTTAEKVAEAFKLILSDAKVKAVLVNIFGGIVRCNLIAEGIISAVKEVHVQVPVIVRLEGTNAEEGRRLLEQSGLALITASDLDEAAKKAVEAAQ
ncbi:MULTISPECIES: ADP-forming succinate--CoA ligase subunit beta [Methylocaldum]|jgi:succinyl-CoA synthetase beta subunit|uniref:ADP-forming succinate--CoA ligase subunit beta n=1 Tax=unclassified Methylocaldum TaxID=2622260 RepID=UPI000A32A8FB|nr:ADP-forming succinate--CoA ligase subunit beta [Methylocaldum sp. RMAD-M]MBP1150362.1 succinyl-CoA synthetase beta subunit [Methylocaldum sp. RMAD-M]MDV3243523.1 ADP-forming succinate--CoA ligase subunit beta [Methylocaldum sp.]MVF24084.1 ADP-forming succinate--CoA ligase subunit beta [Methylocaldum sp. BRCS4]